MVGKGWVVAIVVGVVMVHGIVGQSVNEEQLEVLKELREEWEVLEQVGGEDPSLDWTDANLEAACSDSPPYGIIACNEDGWVTVLELDVPLNTAAEGLAEMRDLDTLLLSNSNFSGSLPASWGMLSNLTTFFLRNQALLTGEIPSGWAGMAKMKNFQIFQAPGLGGALPAWIPQEWPELERAEIYGTSMEGPIPNTWAEETLKLKELRISFTHINESVPAGFASHPTITQLYLDFNELSGELPQDWSGAAVTDVGFQSNSLSGSIPHSWNSSKGVLFAASNNLFSGNIPAGAYALRVLSVDHNNLHGVLSFPTPSDPIQELLIAHNSFSGTIPDRLWTSLGAFDGQANDFNGSLPEAPSDTHSCSLWSLIISDNPRLTGNIPERLHHCPISSFVARNIGLTSSIPTSVVLASSQRLFRLDVSGNQLEGEIPDEGWNATDSRLGHVDLSNNLLSGVIPPSFLNSSYFHIGGYFNLSHNRFSLCDNAPEVIETLAEDVHCDVSFQSPPACGCTGVWIHCLPQDMPSCGIDGPPSQDPMAGMASPLFSLPSLFLLAFLLFLALIPS